ncbi:MAG: AI-2E family transporter [Calditrichia bacterium]|nr:AI-2E family transporter [Calditrichia bacterium]
MDLTIGRFLRFLIAIIVLVVISWLIYSLSTIITILLLSALIAYILDPVASYLEAKGMSRVYATIIIFLLFFVTIGITSWTLLPGLLGELNTLQQGLSLEDTSSLSKKVETFIGTNLGFINVENLEIEEKIRNAFSLLTDELLTILANLLSIISFVVIIPFVVFFLLKDGRKMKKAFVHFVPNRYFEMTLNVLHKIDQQLGWYLRGQFTEAFVVGLLSVIALWLLDVQYFIIIGIFAGLANLIPYVGPVAGAIPAIVVTLVNGSEPVKILYIVVAFALVQLIDNVVLQPMVLSKSVNLHPLIIVFAVLIGGQFFGLLGMLLAVPAAGIIKVTSSELYQGIRKFNLI